MKNITKPENMIGFTKVVDGFNFTLVDKEKMVYMVEITKDGSDFAQLVTVAHNTWKTGKFTGLLRKLNPQPKKEKVKKERIPRPMKPKTIHGVNFRVVEKNPTTKRVKVVGEGYNEVYEMSLSTWYRGRFFNNFMKFIKKIVGVIFKGAKETRMELIPIEKIVSYNLEETAKDLYELGTVHYRKELKAVYKRLMKKFHPDHGGNVNVCAKIIETYKKRDKGLQYLEETVFGAGVLSDDEVWDWYDGLYDVMKEDFGY